MIIAKIMLRDVKLHDTWFIFGNWIFDLLLYAGFSDGPVFKFSFGCHQKSKCWGP
jgi:hypothetical protein